MAPFPTIDDAEIEDRFGYHAANDETIPLHQEVRSSAIEFAKNMARTLPDCREKSLFFTALQEATMWANAAIACNLSELTLGE